MPILGPEQIREVDIDALAMRVFLKSLEILGGPRRLIEYRNLTWVPSLIEAAYTVVLAREMGRTEDEIARFLGITRQTVRNILRADEELVLKRLEGELQEGVKSHTAGALAKMAYSEIKQGRDSLELLVGVLSPAGEALGITWPVEVLRRIKGLRFPLGREQLLDMLSGLRVEGVPFEELVERMELPVQSPPDLLRKVKMALEAQGQ